MHMYKTTESPLSGYKQGGRLSGSFLPPRLLNYHLHYSYLDRLCFGLLRCVRGVFDLGCILVNHRLYTCPVPPTRTCILFRPSLHFPHPSTYRSILYLSLPPLSFLILVLSCLSCGSNSLYLCYAVRALSLSRPTQTCVINPVLFLYLSSFRLPCFVPSFLLVFAHSLRDVVPLGAFLVFQLT